MLTVNGALYKDVTSADFNHYFGETVVAWKLSPTKRRLFIVSNTDGEWINGTYLTRENKFNNKKMPFMKWWESLDPIVLQPLMFNIGEGCAVWRHQLAKNLKKSFPWKSNNIKFYGPVTAKDKLLQNVASIAFGELYARNKLYPGLKEAFQKKLTVATKEGFILDYSMNLIYYRDIFIGNLAGGKIDLLNTCKVFTHKLLAAGLSSSDWAIQDPLPKKVDLPKNNYLFMAGYYPNGVEQGIPGFALINAVGEYRTYNGCKYAGFVCSPGWKLYNAWNQ